MSAWHRIALLLALAAMWSPSYLFMKIGVAAMEPLTVAGWRIFIGTFGLCLLLAWKRTPLPACPRFWACSALMGLLSSAAPFSLFCLAECTIDSALAALLMGCTPMFTAALSHLCLPNDRLTVQKGLGIALCLAGLLLLFYPHLGAEGGGSLMGMALAVLATVSIAFSHVFGKVFMTRQPPFVAPAGQLIGASAVMALLLAFFSADPWPAAASWPPVFSLLFLGFFGTFCAFILYYKILEASGPIALSTVACVIPVGGMLLGFVLLDEELGLSALAAASLIVLGLFLVNELLAPKAVKGWTATPACQPPIASDQ